MGQLIVNCILLLCALFAVSTEMNFRNRKVDREHSFRYSVLCYGLAICAVSNVLMNVTFGTTICYFFYALDRFSKVIIMIEIILLSSSIVKIPPKFVSVSITLLAYFSVLLYFLDTAISKGELTQSMFGVCFYEQSAVLKLLNVLFVLMYIVSLLSIGVFRVTYNTRKRERKEFVYIFIVYGCSAIAMVAEEFMVAYRLEYAPLSVIGNLVSIGFVWKLLAFHHSIILSEEDFAEELAPNKTDIVFILDDNQRVLYMNQRARVLGQIVHDSYEGKKLGDIFKMSPEAIAQISNPDNVNPFGISGVYVLSDRNVNMVLQHRFDHNNDILATCVICYNMEVREKLDSSDFEDTSDDSMKDMEDAVNIAKGARILAIDEDIIFLNDFQRVLQEYETVVSRAVSDADGFSLAQTNIYDLIFVSYEMNHKSGADLVRKIRSLPGDYFRQVPIVFLTTADINDVFADFLDAGFSDYLQKPVSRKQLQAVLTRWAWQRFEGDEPEVSPNNAWSGQYNELSNLLEDAHRMFSQKKYEMFQFCVKGIKRDSALLGLADIQEMASDLESACIYEDYQQMEQLFGKLEADITEVLSAGK